MKRHWKRVLIVILLLAVIGAILFVAARSLGREDEDIVKKEYTYKVKTLKIEPGLNYAFTVTGQAVAGQRANIPAERRANVQEVYVKTGDEVAEGDALLLLHSESLDSSFLNTQLLYANAQANLSMTQAVASNQTASERLRLETAELQLQNTLAQNQAERRQSEEQVAAVRLSASLSVSQAQTALETAQKNLVQTKALHASAMLVAQTGVDNAVRSLKTSMFTGLSTANELLEASGDFRGSAGKYRDLVGRTAGSMKDEAVQALGTAADAYMNAQDAYASMRDAASLAETALDKTLVALNFTVPTGALTETVLNSYIASLSQSLASVRAGIASLESANGSYLAAAASNKAGLVAAQQQVESAQRALDSAKQDAGGTSQAVINAEAQHASALARLSAAEDGARKAAESARLAYENSRRSADLQILGAKNALVSAEDALNQIGITRDKLLVRAPFKGMVADVPVKLGDEVNAGSALITVENPDTLIIQAFVSQEDARRVSAGDEVRIGEDGSGTVTAVSRSADAVSKKYKIEIDPNGADLNPGQFVRIEFTSAAGPDGDRLFIPITAVLIASNETYVWTIGDGRTIKTTVTLGDIQGDHVEVIDGIAPGTEIIIQGGRIIEEEGTRVEVVE
jgi:multidrug efflux pump subunit AcrA (membrane-fusion protein)